MDHTVSVIVQQCGCEEAGQCGSVERILNQEQWRVAEKAVTEFLQCSCCGQCDFFQHEMQIVCVEQRRYSEKSALQDVRQRKIKKSWQRRPWSWQR